MGRGRAPCCAKVGLNRGSWTPEEDMRLIAYIQKYGHANWRALPKQAGLLRCGKSCRLRWINYLRPDLKRGNFTPEEEETIIKLHSLLGNKWSKIASCLPGRTDNEIKNVWNTHLKKKVAQGEKKVAKNKAEDRPSSSSPSSSTTTFSSSDHNDARSDGEHCDTSKEETAGAPQTDKIEIPLDPGIDILDMLVDGFPNTCSISIPTSPCSSSSEVRHEEAPCMGMEELFNLPEIDIEPEIWSMINGDEDGSGGACNAETWQGDATVSHTPTSSKEEGRGWWLENLEKELGLWGPVEDYQHLGPPLGPLGPVDPVSSYFQTGAPTATFEESGSSPVLLSRHQLQDSIV